MTVRIFKHTDVGAPQLQNAAGQLIAVLDACLISGFATRSCTITRVGTVATVVQASHGYDKNNRVTISGAAEGAYNGDFKVDSVVDANTFTYTVGGSPATPATGTILAAKSGAGWTKPYSGANLAAYKQPAALANPVFLRVDDSGTTQALARGYEAMTAISTGTGDFPTVAQRATAVAIPKAASAINAAWVLAVSGGTFWFWCNMNNSADGAGAYPFGFGDFTSYKAGDSWNKFIMGSGWNGGATSLISSNGWFQTVTANMANATLHDHYIARSYTQSGSAVQFNKVSDSAKTMSQTCMGGNAANSAMQYPSPADSGLYMAPVYLYEPATQSILRGEFPGLWNPLHILPLNNYDTFAGVTGLSGREFLALKMLGNAANPIGEMFIETSDTW